MGITNGEDWNRGPSAFSWGPGFSLLFGPIFWAEC